MLTNVAFTVPGEPQGKGRPRATTRGGKARVFTPAKTVAYEGLVAHAAQQAMAGHPPLEGALVVEVLTFRMPPASWSNRKKQEALIGAIRPTCKPDGDNIAKAIGDGGNGVVWQDDAQIVDWRIAKFYGATPGVRVNVAQIVVAHPKKRQSMEPAA